MSAPLRLVLVRHGQTQANIDHVLDTRLPGPPLTDLGREQAAALARDLTEAPDGPVTAVYHSHAARAEQTAAILVGHLGLAPTPVEGTYEVQAGDLEGRSDEEATREFREVFESWQRADLDPRLRGGESGHDVVARFRSAAADLEADHPDGGVLLLVCHGAALRIAATDLVAGRGVPEPADSHVGNCGRVVLERRAPGERDGRREDGPWAGGWRLVAWRHEVPGGLPSTTDATG